MLCWQRLSIFAETLKCFKNGRFEREKDFWGCMQMKSEWRLGRNGKKIMWTSKKMRKTMAVSEEIRNFASQNTKQGRSPAGLERCSHIAEVIGSNPIVPTLLKKKRNGSYFDT